MQELRNLGPRSAARLAEAGIHTRADLEAVGVVAAYQAVKALYPDRVSLNLLYALQGALLDILWHALPDEMQAELRELAG